MIAVDLQNHSLGQESGTIPADHPREGHGYGVLVAATLSGGGHPGSNLPGRHHEDDENLVTAWDDRNQASLDDTHHTLRGAGLQRSDVIVQSEARALTARASGYRMDFETENFLVADPVTASYAKQADSSDRAAGPVNLIVAGSDGHMPGEEVADTLRVEYGEQSFRGDGADNLLVADPISAHEGKTHTHEGKNNFRTHNVVEAAFYPTGGSQGQSFDPDNSPSVKVGHAVGSSGPVAIQQQAGVRRLTPLECERLMGWPDGWTQYTHDGKSIPDSHRYRLCGNGVVSTVAEWIGHRLAAVDRSLALLPETCEQPDCPQPAVTWCPLCEHAYCSQHDELVAYRGHACLRDAHGMLGSSSRQS